MPSHKTHRYTDRLLLGKTYEQVHHAIDMPYKFYRRKHRKFFHTYREAFPIGYALSGETKGGLSGLFHVWLDRECSKDRNFKRFMKWAADQDAKSTGSLAKLRKKVERSQKSKRKRAHYHQI